MRKYSKNYILIVAWAVIVPVFVWQQVVFFGGAVNADTTSEQEAADKIAADEAARQKAIDEANDEKEDIESAIKKAEKARAALQKDLGQIQGAVASTQKAINNTKAVINETATDISRKEAEVNNLNDKIEMQKTMLRGLLQQMYYNQGQPVLNVVLTSRNFADVFSDTDHLLTIEDKLRDLSGQISQTKEQVEQEKIKLAEAKEKHEEILDEKVDQKQELVADQVEVQADIQSKEQIIARLNSKLDELKNEYSKILGKSVSVGDIIEAAAFASNATRMNKSFLLGVLIQESNKGENTGNCTYAQVASGAKIAYKSGKLSKKSYDTMLYRKGIFDNIIKDLGYKESKVKVSCNPSSYTGTGGAMGIPQFMADTWEFGGGKPSYKDEIKRLTGHSKPDPWNLLDGVTAMAIKLSRDGASQKTRFAEAKSYCTYLAGGNWGYYCFGSESKYRKDYSGIDCYNSKYIKNAGEKVLCFKDNYEKYY
ncbi:MAG TPA: hypothetical protein DEA43_05015 [Candidatus Moranbacteria bacterium]|nr:hypothetical protein [Candidatus Moranbacteria bacterium]HBT46212.1 hypothetical protein [Candidatus Moranbacteria bacterium]